MSTNPIVDYHVIYAIALVVAAVTYAGHTWGFGRFWARCPSSGATRGRSEHGDGGRSCHAAWVPAEDGGLVPFGLGVPTSEGDLGWQTRATASTTAS